MTFRRVAFRADFAYILCTVAKDVTTWQAPKVVTTTVTAQKTQRLRGRPLQTLRRRLLSAQPLCVACQRAGRLNLASELDHIVALVNGGGNEEENLQGLCAPCHVDKTALDLGQRVKPVIGLDGWPVVDA